ncbi:MAG: aspartate aminotransferase [Flavobacteriales bacterium]|jgi:aspartate aminotransferase
MHQLSDTINKLSESATLAMSRKSRELREKGIDVISLSLGEPDFNTPDFIKAAAKKAIDENYSTYTPVNGYLSLREAIVNKFQRDNGLTYDADQIVVSTGAKQSISNICFALLNEGDEALLPAPFWVSYQEIVKMAGGTPVSVESDIASDFKLTAEQLEASLNDKTRIIIFSSPCNPTGSYYSREELRSLAAVIAKFPKVIVLSDEIYEHINFSGKHESLAQFPEVYDQVVTVNGVSKSFAMTGWRIGYIGAPLWLAQACTKIQGQVTSGACGISQKAAEAAVSADPKLVIPMREEFEKRRDLMIQHLQEIPGVEINKPEGAFYLFPVVSSYYGKSYQDYKINNSTDLTNYLLEEEHLALVPGVAFGSDNNIRISYASSEEVLLEAMRRFKSGLSKLS